MAQLPAPALLRALPHAVATATATGAPPAPRLLAARSALRLAGAASSLPAAAAAVALGAAASMRRAGRRRRGARSATSLAAAPTAAKLHVYDHCPYCVRAELALGWLGLPYERLVYGYGEGADPEKCGGTGYTPAGGPVVLTGKKMLPVLEGVGVPAPAGMRGLPESLEICSYVAAVSSGARRIAPASGRGDLADWLKRHGPVREPLLRPRKIKMPVKDWADARDAVYAKWKYTSKDGFDYAKAEADTPVLLEQMAVLLSELEPLLRGETDCGSPCANSWGFSMDDILVLPNLRNLTCVSGIVWPDKVRSYVESLCSKAGVALYTEHAC